MNSEGGFTENKVKFAKPSVLRLGKNDSFFRIEGDLGDRRNSQLIYVKFFRPTKDINYNFRINFQDLD